MASSRAIEAARAFVSVAMADVPLIPGAGPYLKFVCRRLFDVAREVG